jgi:hypothetical protein
MRVLLLLLLSTRLFSQETGNNIFTLKPAFGINGCQIHGDNYSGYDKFGLFTGTSVNAKLNAKTSLELGFYFSQKGSRHNPNIKAGDYSFYRVNLNFLDLPLSLRYRVNEKYFITLGPSVAYLISYTEETERGDWTGMYPFRKFETGVNIGLGGMINEKISLELRSSNSVTPLRDWGGLTSQVYYSNPVARFFNKGIYSNILSLFLSYHLDLRDNNG